MASTLSPQQPHLKHGSGITASFWYLEQNSRTLQKCLSFYICLKAGFSCDLNKISREPVKIVTLLESSSWKKWVNFLENSTHNASVGKYTQTYNQKAKMLLLRFSKFPDSCFTTVLYFLVSLLCCQKLSFRSKETSVRKAFQFPLITNFPFGGYSCRPFSDTFFHPDAIQRCAAPPPGSVGPASQQ